MKRLNDYFTNAGVVFSLGMVAAIVLHLLTGVKTMQIHSIVKLMLLAIVTQVVLGVTEQLRIQSGIGHLVVELILMEGVVFLIGLPTGLIASSKISSIGSTVLIVALIEVITSINYFIRTQKEVTIINELLKKRDE